MADPVRQIVERIARDGSHELSREIARQTIEVFDHRDRLLAAVREFVASGCIVHSDSDCYQVGTSYVCNGCYVRRRCEELLANV